MSHSNSSTSDLGGLIFLLSLTTVNSVLVIFLINLINSLIGGILGYGIIWVIIFLYKKIKNKEFYLAQIENYYENLTFEDVLNHYETLTYRNYVIHYSSVIAFNNTKSRNIVECGSAEGLSTYFVIKNFIKDKQSNIHILYLSATPIPRTMNMVYAGLKDFSFLQTPPSNRLNIKSFLKTHTSQLLKEALVREKSRNGQCFIVQNDINKMENLKNEINQLLPEFRIGIAHGKLKKADIQKVMSSFHAGNLDGLICTTIVEMGLDIPNANTMIVINSQNFGLAQLHQLRGRVGRSERQGYCYYLVPNMDIPKLSKDRLASVIKNSKLGEGFLIAQEDLEIRGGGEMLGDKQSGHVENVGMSLYLSMLKSALDNTQESTTINDIEINFYDSAYIDNNYLPSAIERLKIYRKINKIKSSADLIDIKNSLIDRCGKMPRETKNIIENKKLEIIARSIGIKSIKSNKLNTSFLITSDFSESKFDKLINLVKSDPQKFAIDQENKFIYKLNELESITRRQKVTDFLNALL